MRERFKVPQRNTSDERAGLLAHRIKELIKQAEWVENATKQQEIQAYRKECEEKYAKLVGPPKIKRTVKTQR